MFAKEKKQCKGAQKGTFSIKRGTNQSEKNTGRGIMEKKVSGITNKLPG